MAHALAGLATIVFRFPAMSQREREAQVQAWAARMLQVLGVTLEVHGSAPCQGPMLLVANHLSWLDILVLHAGGYCRFVSKADVGHWPLIGRLATGAGTLYIERESRRDALRVVHHMADSLACGDVLAVFPEGTTSDGSAILPFHANLLQAAIAAGAPVQPVALDLLDARTRRRTQQASYIDDETLVGSLWRTLAGGPMVALVRYGTPQHADGRDRRTFAQALRQEVAALRETP